jgi:Ca-activated chloride channel family protein
VVIHTIGIGDPSAEGEARVNLQGLRQISEVTGGKFFRAEDRTALDQVYNTLDTLTPHQVKTLSHQPKRDLFWWPLGAAIGVLALYHLGALLRPRLSIARQRQEA